MAPRVKISWTSPESRAPATAQAALEPVKICECGLPTMLPARCRPRCGIPMTNLCRGRATHRSIAASITGSLAPSSENRFWPTHSKFRNCFKGLGGVELAEDVFQQ